MASKGGGGGKKRRDVVEDMRKLMDLPINVRLLGGREVTGVLKGFDASLNLVLDETREYVRDLRVCPHTHSCVLTPAHATKGFQQAQSCP